MILSSEWLGKYVALPENIGPVLDRLTALGLEVEGVQKRDGNTTFELNITPNRPDCMSFIGVAREIAAAIRKPLRLPSVRLKEGPKRVDKIIQVKLRDQRGCPRYMGRVIENIRVGPSPEWLRRYLASIGQRSINNVVDVTNFVLMEWGQPLHAFDLDQLTARTVIIRKAQAGETLMTLDGQKRLLESSDVVIADARGAVALGGVMGGATAEVSEKTRNIFLESAAFDTSTIRRTSKRLGLVTEASRRFERGVSIEGVPWALDRAAQLIAETSNGIVSGGRVDLYPKKFRNKVVTLRIKRLEQYLGYKTAAGRIKQCFQSLGFKVQSATTSQVRVEVPPHRMDISEEVDLIEEVARLNGYEKIPAWEPRGAIHLEQEIEKESVVIDIIRQTLACAGLSEVVNYSFCGPEDLKKIDWQSGTMAILNPIGEELSVMRPSLIPSLLKNVELNLSHQTKRIRLFELRNVYDQKGGQKPMLAVLMSGPRHPPHWAFEEVESDFYDLKAVLSRLLRQLGIPGVSFRQLEEKTSEKRIWQPGVAAEICITGKVVGQMGKVHPDLLRAYRVKQAVYLFELDVPSVQRFFNRQKHFTPMPKFPSIQRDLSILVPLDAAKNLDDFYKVIREQGTALLHHVRLIDLYRGKAIPAGYQSMTFTLTFYSDERTLKDEEINLIHQKLCGYLETEWAVKIR